MLESILAGVFGNWLSQGLAATVRRVKGWWSGPRPAEAPPPAGDRPTLAPPRLQVPDSIEWLGRKFNIYAYPSQQRWGEGGGLYVLAARNAESSEGWTPLRIDVAGSFQADLPHLPTTARDRGATHLHVHQAPPGEELRDFRERFITRYQPPLNVEAPP